MMDSKGYSEKPAIALHSSQDAVSDSELFSTVMEACDTGLMLLDDQCRVLVWNRRLAEMSGVAESSALKRELSTVMPRLSGSRLIQSVDEALHEGRLALLPQRPATLGFPRQAWAQRHFGLNTPLTVIVRPIYAEHQYCLVQILDASLVSTLDAEVKAQADAQHCQELHTNAILSSIADAVITTDVKGYIDYMNSVAEDLTGWGLMEAKGKPLEEVFNVYDERSRTPIVDPVHKCLKDGGVPEYVDHELVLLHRNGVGVAIEESFAPIRDELNHVIGAVLVFRDVSHARKLAAQVSWQATHDSLTGLVNRIEFDKLLEEMLVAARVEKAQHCLMYLDLDQFKIVNDTCGHVAGDELLRQVASMLSMKMRNDDTLARLGGDEFGVLLRNCPADAALRVANDMRQAVRDYRFAWGDKIFTIGVSIGLAVVDQDTESMESVMSAADAACYTAKDSGRDRVHLFTADEGEAALRQGEMQWVSRIVGALEENRFRLFAQSIVPTTEGVGTEHYEVLIRMLDEEGYLVPPGAFIPAAERFNLMPAIDRWVVQTVFRLIEYNRDALIGNGFRFAINLSGGSITDEDTLNFIGEEMVRHDIPEGMISFELTETAAVANLSSANYFIRTLKQSGCRFSLDDFGSGLSSFAYLKNLPVDYLKIDGAFVKDMADDPIDHAMVEAINQIGHVMGLKTIAEFVENDAILEKLREIGVDYAQGFGIAKPVLLADGLGNLMLEQND
jgi:diguanylate cyclase (GGDEF)-like protein/PAS domain S-box-containing protein